MIDQAATAYAWALGALLALATVATIALAVTWAWHHIRYTRPGWWLHRHWPTRAGR